jgi:hypothetical protein
VKPPPDRLINAAQSGLVIAGDEQLELRGEFEKILPHEPGRYPVAAGQGLDFRLGPAAPLFDFATDNQACAYEPGYVCRMLGSAGCRESVLMRSLAVTAHDTGHGREQGALPIGSGAIPKEHRVLTNVAGQAVAESILNIGYEVFIAGEDPVQKFKEHWAVSAGRDSGDLGAIFIPDMWPKFPGFEVNCPAGCVQQILVRIPLLDCSQHGAIRLRKLFDGRDGLGARDVSCFRWLSALCSGFPTYLAG